MTCDLLWSPYTAQTHDSYTEWVGVGRMLCPERIRGWKEKWDFFMYVSYKSCQDLGSCY